MPALFLRGRNGRARTSLLPGRAKHLERVKPAVAHARARSYVVRARRFLQTRTSEAGSAINPWRSRKPDRAGFRSIFRNSSTKVDMSPQINIGKTSTRQAFRYARYCARDSRDPAGKPSFIVQEYVGFVFGKEYEVKTIIRSS